MRNLLLAAAAGLIMSTAVASAAVATGTLTGSYSVTEQYSSSHGGPGITYNLNHYAFSAGPLVLGTEAGPQNFFKASPAGSCKGGGCSNGVETDLLTITFSNLSVAGYGSIASLSTTATFTAKYGGTILGCAAGDGVSPSHGDTDCLIWSGAANTYDGSTMLSVDLSDDFALDIYLYNATDWNITPQVGFELVDAKPTSVPEPGSLALLATGLVAFGLIRRRRAGK